MSPYRVVFTPEAQEQLVAIFQYIADAGAPAAAERYTSGIVNFCERLQSFPHRGTQRNDIRPGLRITNYRGTSVIAFAVDEAALMVTIVGVFYGGRDYENVLSAND